MKIIYLPLKQLNHILPSQYSILKRCPYKVLLANTYGEPLLPYQPDGHLGNVIHECIRLILTSKIHDKEEFNKIWQELVAREEKTITERGYAFITPLKKSVKGYSIKKLQVRSLLERTKSRKNLKRDSISFNHEQPLKSSDGLISGRVDLVTKLGNHIKITDFKSGRILDDGGEIKENYEDQLKLYAYLFKEERNEFPDELTLVDLARNEYSIEFSEDKCIKIAEEAKYMLRDTNEKARKDLRKQLANESHENCRFCLYKPACEFHWNLDQDERSDFIDLRGKLSGSKQFANGDVNARINNNGVEAVISHLDGSYANKLKGHTQARLEFYNLLKSDDTGRYRAINTTKIYEG